jgi:hypothetical protein
MPDTTMTFGCFVALLAGLSCAQQEPIAKEFVVNMAPVTRESLFNEPLIIIAKIIDIHEFPGQKKTAILPSSGGMQVPLDLCLWRVDVRVDETIKGVGLDGQTIQIFQFALPSANKQAFVAARLQETTRAVLYLHAEHGKWRMASDHWIAFDPFLRSAIPLLSESHNFSPGKRLAGLLLRLPFSSDEIGRMPGLLLQNTGSALEAAGFEFTHQLLEVLSRDNHAEVRDAVCLATVVRLLASEDCLDSLTTEGARRLLAWAKSNRRNFLTGKPADLAAASPNQFLTSTLGWMWEVDQPEHIFKILSRSRDVNISAIGKAGLARTGTVP